MNKCPPPPLLSLLRHCIWVLRFFPFSKINISRQYGPTVISIGCCGDHALVANRNNNSKKEMFELYDLLQESKMPHYKRLSKTTGTFSIVDGQQFKASIASVNFELSSDVCSEWL